MEYLYADQGTAVVSTRGLLLRDLRANGCSRAEKDEFFRNDCCDIEDAESEALRAAYSNGVSGRAATAIRGVLRRRGESPI